MRIAVLHHLATPFLGNAAALGSVQEHFLRRGDPLPDLDAVDGIVSLGGEQDAWAAELQPEVALLRAAVDRDVPVLGVCLGGQLLARALGAQVRRAPARTVEWRALEPLTDDPLLRGLPRPIPALHFNQDVFALPAGAQELVRRVDPAAVEAFRLGRAWGIQFHPDADEAGLESWIAEFADLIGDPAALRRPTADGRIVFENFAKLVADA